MCTDLMQYLIVALQRLPLTYAIVHQHDSNIVTMLVLFNRCCIVECRSQKEWVLLWSLPAAHAGKVR